MALGEDAETIQAQIEEHLRRVSKEEGRREARKTTITQALQQGSVAMLGKGEAVPNIAAKVAELNAKVEQVWREIVNGSRDAAEVLRDKNLLGLPAFRAHCVARWIHAYTRGQYGRGSGPDSLHMGDGAVDALVKLDAAAGSAKEAPQIRFERLLPKLQMAVEAAARKAGAEDVLSQLSALPFDYMRAQNFEHLLCEAGKVFAARQGGGSRHVPKPGYKEAFDAALPFWEARRNTSRSRSGPQGTTQRRQLRGRAEAGARRGAARRRTAAGRQHCAGVC